MKIMDRYEKITLFVLRLYGQPLAPGDLRKYCESEGIDGGQIRNAVARLCDKGIILVNEDMELVVSKNN
jgi:hypothetical protein